MAKKKKSIQLENENGQSENVQSNSEANSASPEVVSDSVSNDGQSFEEHVAEIENKKEENEINSGEYKFDAPEKKVEEKEFDLESIMKEYGAPVPDEKKKRGRKPRASKEPEPARVQMIIPGRLFVTVCDNAAISAIGALDSWISKKPINTDLLKLTDQQIADLSPLAEEAIKAMKLENDPISVYFGSLAAIYISNYLQLRAMMNKMNKENEQRFV